MVSFLSFIVLLAAVAACTALSQPLSVDFTIPAGSKLLSHFTTPTYDAAKGNAGEANGPFSDRVSLCYEYNDGQPSYIRGTAQGWWYFEGPIIPLVSTNNNVQKLTATLQLYANNPQRGSPGVAGTITLSGYTQDFVETGGTLKVITSCSPSLSTWCNDWPSTLTYSTKQRIPTKESELPAYTTMNCFWVKGSARGTKDDLLSYEITAGLGTTYFCPDQTTENPNGIWGSWSFTPGIEYPAGTPARFNGPYLPGSTMNVLPDGGGMVTTQWAGFGFPPSSSKDYGFFNGQGQFGYNIGASLILSLNSTEVFGHYCLIDQTTFKVFFCGPEKYSYNKATNTTAELCMSNANGPWPQLTYKLPSDSELVSAFAPSPPKSSGAFQRDELVSCFEYGTEKNPIYMRGTAQGIWYIEGPVAPSGSRSVLSLYANDPTVGNQAIIGTLVLEFTTNYFSAKILSVSCSPLSWCNKWPVGESLDLGYPTQTNPMVQEASAAAYCLYNPNTPRNPAKSMISEWTSSQGTTYFCNSDVTSTSTQANGVYGSWNYVNGPGECTARGWDSYPCKDNHGPYTTDSITATLPDGSGFLLTQWDGWWFSPPPYTDPAANYGFAVGRSFFASWGYVVQGTYCVFDTKTNQYQYCFPESYTIAGNSTPELCKKYATPPTNADLPPMPSSGGSCDCGGSNSSKNTTSNSGGQTQVNISDKNVGAYIGIAFSCFAFGYMAFYFQYNRVAPASKTAAPAAAPALHANPMHGDSNNNSNL